MKYTEGRMERCVSWDIIALRLIITPMDWLDIGSCYYSVRLHVLIKATTTGSGLWLA